MVFLQQSTVLNRSQPTYMFQHHRSENTHYFDVSNCRAQLTCYYLCTLLNQPEQPFVKQCENGQYWYKSHFYRDKYSETCLNAKNFGIWGYNHIYICVWSENLNWEELIHLVPSAWTSIPVNHVFTPYIDNVHFYLTFKYNSVPMLAWRDGHKIKF